MPDILRAALFLVALCACASHAFAQGVDDSGAGVVEDSEVVRGSFEQLRNMRRVLLVTSKSLTVDTRGPARAVLEEVFKKEAGSLRRHDYAYNLIAKRLNRYVRKYRSMTAVESLDEAEYVIVFKVLNEQPSFIATEPHIYGEMFVILNRSAARPHPVFIWWTKHNQTSIESAVGDFLKELRQLRGER